MVFIPWGEMEEEEKEEEEQQQEKRRKKLPSLSLLPSPGWGVLLSQLHWQVPARGRKEPQGAAGSPGLPEPGVSAAPNNPWASPKGPRVNPKGST